MRDRLPALKDLLPVYGVISCMLYGWTLVLYFWKFPSWLHFLDIGELLGGFSYAMLNCLAESLVVLGFLLGLCLILPGRLLRDSFALRGSVIAFCGLASLMLYQYQFRASRADFPNALWYWILATVLIILLILLLSEKVKGIKSTVLDFSDRLVIFLYLIIPVSLFSLLVVLIRNL